MDKLKDASLSPRARWLLGMHGSFLTGISLSNIFFNVFLWKLHQSIELVAVYNFFQYLAVPAIFYLGSLRAKKWGQLGILRLGLIIHTIFYLLVLVLKEKVGLWSPFLGLLMGIGQGLYYLGYNVSTYDWTNNFNRDRYSGLNGALGALAGMTAPIAGGIMISCLGMSAGYKIVFALAVVFFALAWVISLRLSGAVEEKGTHFAVAVGQIDRYWRLVSWSMALRGLREGVMSFALVILVYELTVNEMHVGFFNMAMSLLTVPAFYLTGKYITRERRYRTMLWGGVLLSLFTLPLLRINLFGLWFFGLANSILYPLVFVPLTTICYNVIRDNVKTRPFRMELLTLREVPLNMGRLLGIAFIFLFLRENWQVAWLVWGLGLTQIPIAFILKPVSK